MTVNPQALELFNSGMRRAQAGELAGALNDFERAANSDPHNSDLINSMGAFFMTINAMNYALAVYSEALKRFPNNAVIQSNVGVALASVGNTTEAEKYLRSAIAGDPRNAVAHQVLTTLLQDGHRFEDARNILEMFVQHTRDNARAWLSLGAMRMLLGDCTGAISGYEQAIALDPTLQCAHSARLFAALFDDRPRWSEVVQLHLDWGKRFVETESQRDPHRNAGEYANTGEPHRRLRIGYVLPFIANHVISELLEPIVAHHDREQFELFAYRTREGNQPPHAALPPHFAHWRECGDTSDDNFCNLLRDDRIDLLIDLTLHLDLSRMGVFVRRPAPIQIGYLAYPATSGLPAFDYRITCPALDPREAGRSGCEHLIQLPDTFWCYPTHHDVAIGPPPSVQNGYITFGSMNTIQKVRASALELWARILARVPESRLMLLVLGGQSAKSVLERVQAAGIDLARVDVVDHVARTAHLDRFNRVDVCLDTFPYGGHTTTHDAIWMGVPMISLAGSSSIGRASECILRQVGLAALVAPTPEEYIERCVHLAADLDRRAALRQTLRDTMRASPLCDAVRFTKHLEAGYRAAWQRWCDGLPPENINVGERNE